MKNIKENAIPNMPEPEAEEIVPNMPEPEAEEIVPNMPEPEAEEIVPNIPEPEAEEIKSQKAELKDVGIGNVDVSTSIMEKLWFGWVMFFMFYPLAAVVFYKGGHKRSFYFWCGFTILMILNAWILFVLGAN